MKRSKYFLVIAIFTLCIQNMYSAQRYWRGNGSNKNWNTTANWSAVSGGSTGASVPGSTDTAYFDGNGLGYCKLDAALNVKRFEILSGYNDTIEQNKKTVTVGTGGYVQNGGTVLGDSTNITVSGIFTLSAGLFQSTISSLSVAGNFTFTGGTFLHNSGTASFPITTGTISGSCTFYNITFPSTGSGSTIEIASGTTMTCLNTLLFTGGTLVKLNTGVIDAKGDITQSNTYATGAGTATIHICGTGTQNLNGHTTLANAAIGWLPNIKINKSSGTLYVKDYVSLQGKWEYITGTVDYTTYNSTVVYPSAGSNLFVGKETINNFMTTTYGGSSNTITINTGDTIIVAGTTDLKGVGATSFTGIISLRGNINISNTYTGFSSGAGTILIDGTGNQIMTSGTVIAQGRIGNLIINKPSGTLYLKDVVNADGNWTYIAGTLDATTYSNQLVFCHGCTITGSQTFNNLTFYCPSGTNNTAIIASGTTLTVNGELKYNPFGSGTIILNTGTIEAKGDITELVGSNTAGVNSGGTALINITGTGNQTITGTASTQIQSVLTNVTINKPSGNLYLINTVMTSNAWTYTAGTVVPGTSTVIFVSPNSTITGTQTFYNLTFETHATNSCAITIPVGTTVNVNGTLQYTGPGYVQLNTGTLNLAGNFDILNTSTSLTGGGSATINFNGSGDQTLTGASTLLQGRLCNININKASGILYLKNKITVSGNWVLTTGTLDAITYGSGLALSSGTRNVSGSQTLYNLLIDGSNSVSSINTLGATDTITVNGQLKFSGNASTNINGGTINAKGDITVTATSTNNDVQTGTINICGTGNQTYTGSGISNAGQLCAIKVNKPAGTLTLSSIFTIGGLDWTYIQGTVNPGTSTAIFKNNGNVSCTNGSASMAFNNFNNTSGTRTMQSDLRVNGSFTNAATRVVNANGKKLYVGGDWLNSGTFTYANSKVIFNGSSNQYFRFPATTETLDTIEINKPTGKIFLAQTLVVNKSLQLTKGTLVAASGLAVSLPDNATITGGADTAYVSGIIKKTGNDAFTFPLGDTALATGAFHPLSITAPSVATDAFTAQYFSTGQTYSDSIQVDSLASISTCEYWNLNRKSGTSSVIPTLGWSSSSCNVDQFDDLRVAYLDTVVNTWKSLGPGGMTISASGGTLSAAVTVPGYLSHLVLAKMKPSSSCALLRRELDGGYHIITNGHLLFKYDEEYNDVDNKLVFNIYNDYHTIVATNSGMPSALQPTVVYGDNRYDLNVLNCAFSPSGYLGNGFFVLEVINEKNEKRYLRFKNIVSAVVLCPGADLLH